MRIELPSGKIVWLIGDPHIGKKFEAGVPLARRGEREKKQMDQFISELNTPADYVVIVGDLFDHPYVSYDAVLATYRALVNAATVKRNTKFVVMAGNHDVPRNLEAVGAFHVLESMAHLRVDNLLVTRKAQQYGPIAVFPWQWELNAAQQVQLIEIGKGTLPESIELAVGHWDLKTFGESDTHLAPTALIRRHFGKIPIASGHYHVEGTYDVNGIEVLCTGSLQPYSHGEDPKGDLYVTVNLDELGEQDFKDKCVRVLLREGEELPSEIDCLALTGKRVNSDMEPDATVDVANFNWNEILEKNLADVEPHVKEFIKERLLV